MKTTLTLWRPAAFGDFLKKTPKRTWHGPGQSVKRCGKSSSLHPKKNFLLGGAGFL